ncbi:RagB/SusD family nutrient uptake outer membrane protein [soil metagenome]|nr:RagB/SusD family nutrient uptake outer membrane protein [Gemmatimonadota bacterium]
MKWRYFTWIAAVALLAACDDSPLDTNPTASIDAETALTTPRGIELGVTGAYRSLQDSNLYSRVLLVYPDLYADNLDFTGTFQTDREVSLRAVSPSNSAFLGTWGAAYAGINRANNVLAAIPNVSALSQAQAQRFRGEALFIRSLHYFNLLRYFGGVPIVTEPSQGVGEESQVPRSSADEVYDLIIGDLEEAATLLPTGRVPGQATQGAANALLARVYLERGGPANWEGARDRATSVIQSGSYELVQNYRTIFTTKNSSESIFELQYSINNTNALAFWFFPQALGGRYGFAPSANLFNAYPAGDTRRDASIGMSGTSRYGDKYFRISTEDDNVIVLRLAEMYLIRAEANARLNADPALVRADINVVRNRAGLSDLPGSITSQQALLDAILQERRLEFAMEGLRFFDLRRMGEAQEVLNIPAERLLFPIPQGERDVNPNLEQNPGY